MSVFILETRSADLTRTGQIDDRDIADFTGVRRRNNVGAWSITLPQGSPALARLAPPGSGIVATLDGETLISGPVVQVTREIDPAQGLDQWTFTGLCDNHVLADRTAFPSPSVGAVSAQTTDYDNRSGAAESVIRGYVLANVGAQAPANRRNALLDVEDDQARGGQVTAAARFDVIGELAATLGETGGVDFEVRQEDERLVLRFTQPRQLGTRVQFSPVNNTADKVSYSYSVPTVTRVLVGAGGEDVSRYLSEQTNVLAEDAEASWGRRVEQFLDQRQIDGLDDFHLLPDTLAQLAANGNDLTAQANRLQRVGDTVNILMGSVTANADANLIRARLDALHGDISGLRDAHKALDERLDVTAGNVSDATTTQREALVAGFKGVLDAFAAGDRDLESIHDTANTARGQLDANAPRQDIANTLGAARTILYGSAAVVRDSAGLCGGFSGRFRTTVQADHDARQLATEDAVRTAAADPLSKGGTTVVGLKVTPTDTGRVRFRRDWYVGDYPTIYIPGPGGDASPPIVVTQRVEEASFAYGPDGFHAIAAFGDPGTATTDPIRMTVQAVRQQKALISRLERRR